MCFKLTVQGNSSDASTLILGKRLKVPTPIGISSIPVTCSPRKHYWFLAQILKIATTAELELDSMVGLISWVTWTVTSARAFES